LRRPVKIGTGGDENQVSSFIWPYLILLLYCTMHNNAANKKLIIRHLFGFVFLHVLRLVELLR
jgi:hypothetical protein